MFDLGWLELIVIGIVALIVVGPKDLPGMFRTVGRFMGKARAMAREFQRSMEEAADETGLKDAAKSMNDIGDVMGGPTKSAQSYAKKFMSDEDETDPSDAKPPKAKAAPAAAAETKASAEPAAPKPEPEVEAPAVAAAEPAKGAE